MTTRTPPNKCLLCGAMLDAATSMGNKSAPDPGSLSICGECGAVSVFADDLTLRPLTDVEVREITSSDETMQMLFRATGLIQFVKAAQN